LALLIYCYANGIFSSRRIERATHRDLGVRFLTGNTHPDHDTICSFRRRNEKLIEQLETEVKELLAKAEQADSQGEVDPARLPEEIAKRQELQARLRGKR
jgi:hypothetical protein